VLLLHHLMLMRLMLLVVVLMVQSVRRVLRLLLRRRVELLLLLHRHLHAGTQRSSVSAGSDKEGWCLGAHTQNGERATTDAGRGMSSHSQATSSKTTAGYRTCGYSLRCVGGGRSPWARCQR
jgi:hypothetical protein